MLLFWTEEKISIEFKSWQLIIEDFYFEVEKWKKVAFWIVKIKIKIKSNKLDYRVGKFAEMMIRKSWILIKFFLKNSISANNFNFSASSSIITTLVFFRTEDQIGIKLKNFQIFGENLYIKLRKWKKLHFKSKKNPSQWKIVYFNSPCLVIKTIFESSCLLKKSPPPLPPLKTLLRSKWWDIMKVLTKYCVIFRLSWHFESVCLFVCLQNCVCIEIKSQGRPSSIRTYMIKVKGSSSTLSFSEGSQSMTILNINSHILGHR